MKDPLIIINGRFLTQRITGVQRYATEVVLALSRLRCQYRFLVVAPKGKLVGTVPYTVQDTFPLIGHAWEQIRLPWLANKYKADLVWCPGNSAPMIRSKVHLLVTMHDAAIFSGPEWFSIPFRLFYQKLISRVGKIAKIIITNSNFSKEELIKYTIAGEDKIKVIYWGINHLDLNININKMNRLRDLSSKIQDKSYILILGSRDPRKNLNRFLSAWNSLSLEEKKGMVLVVTGGQSAAFAREKTAEIKNDVVFLGYVPDEQLPSLYRQAEAFVFPSLYEGFGFPPLEGMAYGIPALVAAAGSLPEVCGDAALYCDPYSVNDIAEKITLLISDPDLGARLREKGKEQVKKYSWEESAREHLKVIDELIQG